MALSPHKVTFGGNGSRCELGGGTSHPITSQRALGAAWLTESSASLHKAILSSCSMGRLTSGLVGEGRAEPLAPQTVSPPGLPSKAGNQDMALESVGALWAPSSNGRGSPSWDAPGPPGQPADPVTGHSARSDAEGKVWGLKTAFLPSSQVGPQLLVWTTI